MSQFNKNKQNVVDNSEEFLELQTMQQIEQRFKDFQIQHHYIYQKRQDQVVQKLSSDQQKQNRKAASVGFEKDPFQLPLKVKRNFFPQQEQFCLLKEMKKVSSTIISSSQNQSPLAKSPKKAGTLKIREKLKKFTAVKDFLWLIRKLAKSNKKYDFLKDQEMCKEFGIDLKKLIKMQTYEQREEYILNCFMDNMKQHISSFNQSLKETEKMFDHEQEILQNNFIKLFESKDHDLLDWLKIENKYDHLSKKIKLCLVENIHDSQNTNLIRQQIENKQKQSQSYHKNNQKESSGIIFNIKQYMNIPSQLQSAQHENQNDPQKSNNKVDQIQQFEDIFEWNSTKEQDFKNKKQEVKSELSQKIASSNWYDLSMIPVIQQVQVDQGIVQYRESLMQKHKNRDHLTDQELQFLATTSELLNRNIDKKYVQKVIDQLDEKIIDQIENNIAEEIINKYNKVLDVAKNKRNQYIKIKAEISGKHIQENDYFKVVKEDKQQHYHTNLMKNKVIEKLCDGYKMSQIKLHIKKSDALLYQFAKSLSDKIDSEEPIKHTIHSKKWQNFYQKQVPNKNTQEKSIFQLQNGEDITVEKSQRLFHPSSKLVLNLEYLDPHYQNNNDGQYLFSQQDITKIKKQQEQMMKQRLNTKDVRLQSQKNQFKQFYSSGPLDSAQKHGNKNQTDHEKHLSKRNAWITDEIREKAAIIIQKNVRIIFAKKKKAYLKEHKHQYSFRKQKLSSINLSNHSSSQNIHTTIQKQIIEERQNSLKKLMSSTPTSKKYQIGGSLSPKDKFIIMGMKFKHKQRLVQDRVLEDDTIESKSDISQSTRNGSPQQSTAKHNLQETTFMSYNQTMNSPTSLSNPYLKQDFSSFLDKPIDERSPRNSFLNNQQQLKKTMTSSQRNLAILIDNQFETPKQIRKQSFSTKNQSFSNTNNQVLTQQSESTKYSKDKIELGSGNIQTQKMQLLKLKTSPNMNMVTQSLKSSPKGNNQEIFFKKQKVIENNVANEERQKNLELLRAKMYKNSLLVKQQKLLSASIHNSYGSIKNAGYVLNKNDVNVKDKKGNSPIFYCVKNKNDDFVNFLLDLGSNVNERCENGNTPLHIAFQIGNEVTIMNFMEKGGDLNIVNNDNQTPLAMGSFQLIKKMGLEKGVARYVSNMKQQQNENQFDSKHQNGSLELDLNSTVTIDNNLIFNRAYKKKKEIIDYSNQTKKQQIKTKEIHFNNELIKDIQAIENEQNMTYQISMNTQFQHN